MAMHDGHRIRMKREFLARPDSFPNHKLLELLLFYANPRGDTNPTATSSWSASAPWPGCWTPCPRIL